MADWMFRLVPVGNKAAAMPEDVASTIKVARGQAARIGNWQRERKTIGALRRALE